MEEPTAKVSTCVTSPTISKYIRRHLRRGHLLPSNVELCGAPRQHRMNMNAASRRVRTNAMLEGISPRDTHLIRGYIRTGAARCYFRVLRYHLAGQSNAGQCTRFFISTSGI